MNGYTRATDSSCTLWFRSRIYVSLQVFSGGCEGNMETRAQLWKQMAAKYCTLLFHITISLLEITSFICLLQEINQRRPAISHADQAHDFIVDPSKSLVYPTQNIQTASAMSCVQLVARFL